MNEIETDEDSPYDLVTTLVFYAQAQQHRSNINQIQIDPLEIFQHIFSAVIRIQPKKEKYR